MTNERLHKFLARCGVAARRKAEELILAGRVTVNGKTVRELGVKIDPARDRIAVDGQAVRAERKCYILLHKPRGVVTTVEDDLGRRTVLDLLPPQRERLYPVGRLDRDSEGLILLTNDGDLAYYLTHPSCGVRKTYFVTVEGEVTAETIKKMVAVGVPVGPLRIKPLAASIRKRLAGRTVLEITVAEGMNREVRRLFAALGQEVKSLVRVRMGPLCLKGLGEGKYRQLTDKEVALLRQAMSKAKRQPPPVGRKRLALRRIFRGKPDPAQPRKIAQPRRAPCGPVASHAPRHPLVKGG